MERSKRSLNVRMKHDDDYGMSEDSNLSRLEPDSVRASIKEDSQRTTTLTDNKKRDYENEGSSMHEDSCIGINYAHMFPKCFRSLHTLLGFSLCTSCRQFLLVVAVTIYSILTCTRIPCRDSHCENGSFEVLSSHWLAGPGALVLRLKRTKAPTQEPASLLVRYLLLRRSLTVASTLCSLACTRTLMFHYVLMTFRVDRGENDAGLQHSFFFHRCHSANRFRLLSASRLPVCFVAIPRSHIFYRLKPLSRGDTTVVEL